LEGTDYVIVAFDEYEIDLDAFELRHGGEPIPVEPQVFEVLGYLASNPGRLITKEELLDKVWGDQFVSESALSTRIKTARQVLGDSGRLQRYIKTVHGRGYRFDAGVDPGPGATAAAAPTDSSADPSAPPMQGNGNLPAERTELFGRADWIDEVVGALSEDRLVSLLGMGGTGKTRLALAAARSAADQFADGVWFVDLVPVDHGDGVPTAIAAALGLAIGSSAGHQQVAELLSSRNALLVLDNVEHLVDSVAEVLDQLLATTEKPKFLVTSRVPVGLIDERRMAVDPLTVDEAGAGPAVELFHAAARRQGITIDNGQSDLAAGICRNLDGLPLAIELAAAQLGYLDLSTLAARLDSRFDLLAHDSRGSDRHASLQAVLLDAWDGLDDADRQLLSIVSCFPGRFGLADIEGVVAQFVEAERPPDIAGGLRRLVERSLVVREPGPALQYRLLETVKLFARRRDDGVPHRSVLDRHAAWCLDRVARHISQSVFDFEQSDWCASHYYDLDAAGRHLIEAGRIEDAARLIIGTAMATHSDSGSRAADTLLRVESLVAQVESDDLRAALHLVGVLGGMATREPQLIADHGRQAFEHAERTDDPALQAIAAVLYAWSVVFRDRAEALALTERALALADNAGETDTSRFANGYRAFMLSLLRRYDEACQAARSIIDPVAGVPHDYPGQVNLAALAGTSYLSDGDEMLQWAARLAASPSVDHPMWSNQLIAASVYGSVGDIEQCRDLCLTILRRLEQAGQSPFPDLLIPIATLAHRLDESGRGRRWLDAVRSASVPTQSLSATLLYRRLREEFDRLDGDDGSGAATDSPETISVDDAAAQALDWLGGH
jgi:predicted ATPase/DNA-binding winged helix-turn-helix (wHTH) protein